MSFDRYHHGDLPNALVVKGLDLARDGGPTAVSVRAAARLVGVSHAAAYRHFKDRKAFVATVAASAMHRLAAVLEEAVEQRSPLERFPALARAYVSWAVSNPGAFRVAFSEELWDKRSFPALREASDRASGPVLAAAADYLGASGSEAEWRQLAIAAWAQVHGFAVLVLDRQLTQGELSVGDGEASAHLECAATALRVLAVGWRDRV